ncbi:MAG: glycine dehydrogenase (aminomethyl-transferring) [Candidatus Aminicenantes bacterium RBG_16_63_14]|nr:MAG: glycine dehydrogenase (aminomethyl-transferring) [Candidatus Aminicenantes bacterium RBG_16_63_14]OGD29125.1 MAG: glycine dehydrogenase (aminomethyl-transferring) [Candidatus Aminicenantes bacterium RBG_19FT_COMBO_65_30]
MIKEIREPLIFEISESGKRAAELPALDVAEKKDLLAGVPLRRELEDFPEVSETEVTRHFTRLSQMNYCVDLGLYPLGSCTMKYNPKINERLSAQPAFAGSHPLASEDLVQGNLEVLKRLETYLCEIAGMDAFTLQPAAGAHGELTGMMLIRAALEARGDARKYVLIPDSAHGTNPSSAHICGYSVKEIKSNDKGMVDVEALEAAMTDEVAALMVTNPNTLGVFESDICRVAEIIHAKGGLVYMDGANMNALTGVVRPGDMGIDVLHINLHKTFSTPHGGGGPGSGPVGVKKELVPFLPVPVIGERGGRFVLDFDRPATIGRVRGYFGNFSVIVRALCYILTLGPKGVREIAEFAVLNANYIRKSLEGEYHLKYTTPSMHECVFSDKIQKEFGVTNLDIAKRLIDYGVHPPTMSFPLIVHGALMIEPTETESRRDLDHFIDAMKAIAREAKENPEILHSAPHVTYVSRLDEVAAAKFPVLRWEKKP